MLTRLEATLSSSLSMTMLEDELGGRLEASAWGVVDSLIGSACNSRVTSLGKNLKVEGFREKECCGQIEKVEEKGERMSSVEEGLGVEGTAWARKNVCGTDGFTGSGRGKMEKVSGGDKRR